MGYLNPDNLYKRFGTDEVTVKPVGEYRFDGPFHLVEVVIPAMTALLTTNTILSDTVIVPINARIFKVVLITDTIVTGSSSTLDFGLIAQDRATVTDDDGLLAAVPLTEMDAAGESTEYTQATTYNGDLIGTTLAADGLLIASYNTNAFTAGAIRLHVYWYKP